MKKWTIEDSKELYNINGWGTSYFGINEQGNVYVTPFKDGTQIDLHEVMNELALRDVESPVLLRFPDILDNRIEKTWSCFKKAAKEYDYKGENYVVYPIKVNQMQPVVEEIISHGRKFNLGLEAGSKPELHAVIAMQCQSDSIIICNGYKDENYIELALLAQKMGKQIFIVVEKMNELEIIANKAKKMGIRPNIGIRIKLASSGSGKWEESGGDASKFGLWLSTSFTTNYDEKTVMSFIDGMEERGIPLQVFHFDCFWMKDFHWSDFVWDSRVFPDPKGMLSRIKEKGLKVCVWINSYIAQESCLFAEGMEKGYFVKRKNGDVWQWDMWQPGMALVDFTNPAACKWFQDKLEVLLDMGVDCFKTDFGERIPTEDVVYYDGSDPVKMHNYYTYLYNKTVYELLQRKRGKDDAVLFARSATAGGQKFPVHWGGDCWSNYEAMAESMRGGLSLTMSGFGYWSHDIGGFEDTSTPDVYKRWAAFGLLSTHSRFHGSTSYRVPWAYDDEAVDVVRFFTKLKLSLTPYLYSSAVRTSRTGVPMMRSMVLEFENDPVCQYLDRQYMLGDSLLVAPIFNDRGEAYYYLPEGTWTNYLTGETVEGGVWRKEHHDYMSIPLWARENTILPVNYGLKHAADSYKEGLELKVIGLKDQAETTVYEDQKEILQVSVAKDGGKISVKAAGNQAFTLRFVNCTIKNVQGAEFTQSGTDSIVTVTDPSKEIICEL